MKFSRALSVSISPCFQWECSSRLSWFMSHLIFFLVFPILSTILSLFFLSSILYFQLNYWTFQFYLPSSLCFLSHPSFIFSSIIGIFSSICHPLSVLYLIPHLFSAPLLVFPILSDILSLFSISSLLSLQLYNWSFQFYLLSSLCYLSHPSSIFS